MRIYLDQSVIQDLKRETDHQLLGLILADNKQNIYCYSEAHLHDLRRDKTNEKFEDMELLGQVASNNFITYEHAKVTFKLLLPREYYDQFEWDTIVDPFAIDDPFFSLLLLAVVGVITNNILYSHFH